MTDEVKSTAENPATVSADANTADNAVYGKKSSPFEGIKEQKGLKAKIKFFFDVLEKYPEIRQMVLFTLFSMLCALGQLGTTFLLQYTLVYIPSMQPPFRRIDMGEFFLFDYDTTAAFVGFLCGATVGQVLTFILNRKKTFRATNNIIIAAIMYTIMAVLVTLMQTLVGGWVTVACQNAHPVDKNSFLYFIYTLTGLAAGGILAFVACFLGNKYLVMRNWKKKPSVIKTSDAAAEIAADKTEEKN